MTEPNETSPPGSIVLYGATGYTGSLVAHELDRRGASFVIAGRSRAKLEELSSALGRRVEIRVADASDRLGLRDALAGARVGLSCAGPFTELGPPVQDAALDAGAHFLDVTGEQGYMRATFARDAEARSRGVALVNAVGFDVVPTDLALHLAAEGLGRIALAELALSVTSADSSRGTIRSALARIGDGGVCHHDGVWCDEPLGRHRREVAFPAPVGVREAYSLPWGDVATAPRTTGAREVRVYMRLPRSFARALPVASRLRGLLGRLATSGIVDRWSQRLPEGPAPHAREATKFAIWARAVSEDGRAREVTALGSDPYGLTAVTAAHAAIELASGKEAGRHVVGALTPTQALDPVALRAVLAAIGTTFEVS